MEKLPTLVEGLVQGALDVCRLKAEQKGVTLEARCEPGLEARLNGALVEQALVNLIDNALKHSSSGSTVTVGLESPALDKVSEGRSPVLLHLSPIRLYVEHHGSGIPPEEHQRIFERFYRCGSELRRETQGVGIGLIIVKHIAEAHGGRVTTRSEVGRGSRFTMELPMNAEEKVDEN